LKTFIEINGQKIDPTTGKQIGDQKLIRNNSTQKVIDGFVRKRPQNTQLPQKPETTKTQLNAISTLPHQVPTPLRKNAGTIDMVANHRKPQNAKTLLRSIVKKPEKITPQINATSSLSVSRVEHSATGRGLLLKRVPDDRFKRASETSKTSTISRFTNPFDRSVTPTITELPVSPAPVVQTPPVIPPTLIKPKLGQFDEKREVFRHPVAQILPKKSRNSMYRRSLFSFFKLRPRVIAGVSAAIAVIAGAGFLAYMKVPAVGLKVVNAKAGFSATIPAIVPSGYSFKGPMQFADGAVVESFSADAHKAFSIVQRPSNLTSDSLLSKYILSSNFKYQSYSEKGLIVYIYNSGDAMWVNNGIWYTLIAKGNLTSDDILSVAGSM
jgi:hypothetical protein